MGLIIKRWQDAQACVCMGVPHKLKSHGMAEPYRLDDDDPMLSCQQPGRYEGTVPLCSSDLTTRISYPAWHKIQRRQHRGRCGTGTVRARQCTCMRLSDRLMRALGTLTSSTAQRTGVPCWTTDSGVMTTSHDSSEMWIMPCRSRDTHDTHLCRLLAACSAGGHHRCAKSSPTLRLVDCVVTNISAGDARFCLC